MAQRNRCDLLRMGFYKLLPEKTVLKRKEKQKFDIPEGKQSIN